MVITTILKATEAARTSVQSLLRKTDMSMTTARRLKTLVKEQASMNQDM